MATTLRRAPTGAFNAEHIIKRYDQLKSGRMDWENTWQEVADYVRPVRNQITRRDQKGTLRRPELADSTAVVANERFASGLYGYMVRPDEQWFQLLSAYEALMADEEVSKWFNDAERIIMRNIYLSNFAQEIYEDFLDMGAFGTSCLYVERGGSTAFKFRNIDIASYVCQEGASGRIDYVIVEYEYTTRVLVQEFGEENLPGEIVKEWDKERKTGDCKTWTVFHMVAPCRRSGSKFVFDSVWVEKETKAVLREGGYNTIPYIVARFLKDPDETYGRGPGINMLPEIKMLNAIKSDFTKAVHKKLMPPLAVAHNSVLNQPSLEAGKINYIRGSMFQERPVPLDIVGDVGVGDSMMKMEQDIIKEGFYTDMFDYLVGGKYMTATEVEARKQSKMFLFAPLLGRIQSEKLSPIIERCFNILMEDGMFPPMPDALRRQREYSIMFSGRMSLALQHIETNATYQTLNMIQPLANIDPSILDNFDWNGIARGTGIQLGMPSVYIRPKEEVQAEREAKAKQQEQLMQAQMAQQASETAKNLSGEVAPTSVIGKATGG